MAAQIKPKHPASASHTEHLTKHAAMMDVRKRRNAKAFASHTVPRLLINDAPMKNVQTMPSRTECVGSTERGNSGPRLLQRNCAGWKVVKAKHARQASVSSMVPNAKLKDAQAKHNVREFANDMPSTQYKVRRRRPRRLYAEVLNHLLLLTLGGGGKPTHVFERRWA